MRAIAFRIARILTLGVLAALGYSFLHPRGLGWVVVVVLGIAIAVGPALVLWRRSRVPREVRWLDTMDDPPRRKRAIDQVTAALARVAKRDVQRRVTLSVVLAQLLDADGQAARAVELFRGSVEGLANVNAALMRHTIAVVALRAGDVETASQILAGHTESSGDRELDARIELLAAYVQIERGHAQEAHDVATAIRREFAHDDDVATEAEVVMACALDALGRRDEANALLDELPKETRDALVRYGQPRAQRLMRGEPA